MAYGMADVVQQRRMIDESEADEEFKRVSRGKLEALVGLAETAECRRVRLLAYFGETGKPCGNCDNCLHPPTVVDATESAQKALSAVYRTGQRFGAGHLIDILRGQSTDRVRQLGHDTLKTFGVGADLSDKQWRALFRHLVASGHLDADAEAFGALRLTSSARAILKGEQSVALREAATDVRGTKRRARAPGKTSPVPDNPGAAGTLDALRAWRRDTAQSHGVPAYVIFHDATLMEIASRAPASLDELATISGIGAKKLERYGSELLALLQACATSADRQT
jgi:ATP-dependent DNA helicase RecQ